MSLNIHGSRNSPLVPFPMFAFARNMYTNTEIQESLPMLIFSHTYNICIPCFLVIYTPHIKWIGLLALLRDPIRILSLYPELVSE